MVIKPLSELEPHERGKIVKVGGVGGIKRRLLDMGVVSGSAVEMKRVAPLGDPVEIKVRGYDLALRKAEAANIQVDVTYLKKDLMPLSMASQGDTVEIAMVRAGWSLQRRLADMGLTPGVKVKLLNSGKPGPVVIDVRGSKLALGYGVAHKVMVVAGENQG
ncbi:ferrous iron transport protein A [Chloroflexota bacterium]